MFFAYLSSRRRFKSSSDNVANLDFDFAMIKQIKRQVSVLVEVTSACLKLLSVGMTPLLHIKDILSAGMTYEKQSKQELAARL